MVKLIVMFPRPAEPMAFDEHYFSRHAPLVRRLPGLEKLEVCRLKTGPETNQPHYLIAEMYFRDKDAMKAALKSPEMAACAKDVEEALRAPMAVYLSDDIQG